MNVISFINDRRLSWATIVLLTLGLWLGGSLVVSLVVMPTLYAAGMMAEGTFAPAGYSLFWTLNRLELVSAAIVLTGVLVMARNSCGQVGRGVIALAALLLLVPLLDTYILTPEMTALGAQLDLFGDRLTVPQSMAWLHGSYWGLELVKLGLGLWLFRHIDQTQRNRMGNLLPQ